MRTRGFAITVLVLCGVMALVCLPLALRTVRIVRLRFAYRDAVNHYNAGRLREALPLLDRCIRSRPTDVKLYQLAGYISMRMVEPDYERARGYYEKVVEHAEGQDAVLAHLQLGAMALQGERRDLDKAIQHLEAALDKDEGLTDAHAALGIAYALRKLPDRASRHLDAAWNRSLGSVPSDLAISARLWQVALMLERGEVLEASQAYDEVVTLAPDLPRSRYLGSVALARIFRANQPDLSVSLREFYIQGVHLLPSEYLEQHGVTVYTLAAIASETLGKADKALDYYRQAFNADQKSALTRRNLAHALWQAAERASEGAARKELRDEGLKLYRELLDEGKLQGGEKRQVALALASIAWNEGRRDDAQKLIQSTGSTAGALVARMGAAAAIRKRDFRQALALLQQALKDDPDQPDVVAFVQRLQTPPEIRNLRANRLSPYDDRPIISATVLPRAVPEPIPAGNLRMTLNGKAVAPIFTQAECFFRPDSDLPIGDYRVELAATDTLGLSATASLTFKVEPDKDPPAIVGLAPEPDSEIRERDPMVAFRCTDPSGISATSLSVVFIPAGSSREYTIISRGVYQVEITASKIDKGTPVRGGAVSFQFSKVPRGEHTMRVSVSDTKGNRAATKWSFKVVD